MWSSDDGFTFMEVITALALMGILMVVIWGVSSNTVGSLGRLTGRIAANVEIVRLDSVLRTDVERIDTPYWFAAPRVVSSKGGLRIFYLDGEAKKSLALTFTNGALTVTTESELQVFRGIISVTMSEQRATANHGDSVEVAVTLKDGEHVELELPFGGYPFPYIGS